MRWRGAGAATRLCPTLKVLSRSEALIRGNHRSLFDGDSSGHTDETGLEICTFEDAGLSGDVCGGRPESSDGPNKGRFPLLTLSSNTNIKTSQNELFTARFCSFFITFHTVISPEPPPKLHVKHSLATAINLGRNLPQQRRQKFPPKSKTPTPPSVQRASSPRPGRDWHKIQLSDV